MSAVRMCDRCARVFSELESGWQTYSAATVVEDEETGERRTIMRVLDACPECALVPITKTQRLQAELARSSTADAVREGEARAEREAGQHPSEA